jgi:hypothetical protein
VRRRNWVAVLLVLFALVLGHAVLTRAVIARIVLPPHASRTQVLTSILNPPYQMAAPHYNLLSKVREYFVPTVHAQVACGLSPCAFRKDMPVSNSNCTSGDFCPDCFNGPCTIHECFSSPNQKDICDDSYESCSACTNTGPCRQ